MGNVSLFLLGFTPFFFGGLQNWAMRKYPDVLFPYLLTGLVFWAIWFGFALLFGGQLGKQAVLWLNLPGGIVLALLFVQEVLLGAYWRNAIGVWTQQYFLPLLHLGFQLTSWSHSVFTAYLAAFLLMVGASFLGTVYREKRTK